MGSPLRAGHGVPRRVHGSRKVEVPRSISRPGIPGRSLQSGSPLRVARPQRSIRGLWGSLIGKPNASVVDRRCVGGRGVSSASSASYRSATPRGRLSTVQQRGDTSPRKNRTSTRAFWHIELGAVGELDRNPGRIESPTAVAHSARCEEKCSRRHFRPSLRRRVEVVGVVRQKKPGVARGRPDRSACLGIGRWVGVPHLAGQGASLSIT